MKQQVAIYLRLSQEDMDQRTSQIKDESNSISAQRLLLTRHLDLDPLLSSLPRLEFCDDGYTGTNFERPGVQKLLEKVRDSEIDCIVVKDFSRFARDYIELGSYLEQIFPFMGVRFISINDHYDSKDYKGSVADIDVNFKNLLFLFHHK